MMYRLCCKTFLNKNINVHNVKKKQRKMKIYKRAMVKIIKKLWRETLKALGLYSVRRSCYGVEIPNWCIGDSVNSYKYKITEKQQERVRNWYLKNLPEKCETITDFKSNWIGRSFGTAYYSGSSKQWNDFRLCVGNNIYVRLY